MTKIFIRVRAALAISSFLLAISYSQQSSAIGKEFITSATYGVLAGTMVGAATLAFTDNPGDNLGRIARGASLGLYAGIALGLYVTYGIQAAQNYEEEYSEDEEGSEEYYDDEVRVPRPLHVPVAIYPVISERGVDGVAATVTAFTF